MAIHPLVTGSFSGVDSVGTEVGVRADYTLAKGLVFTLVGGYLAVGDDTGRFGTGPPVTFDSVTKVAAVVNYGF